MVFVMFNVVSIYDELEFKKYIHIFLYQTILEYVPKNKQNRQILNIYVYIVYLGEQYDNAKSLYTKKRIRTTSFHWKK